uniref:FKB95-like N-terminal Kelch domain-containing protein n=1 Tax=Quercus lobata TaxID=97700 RepID=A0A7N2MZY2_QUELO
MEEKDSVISGPYEEFRICFCGKIRSGSVEWYLIDVSVEEACLSEKTESSTRELTPFSVAKHLPSYAALGGLIYSLGGERCSYRGGDTLLNDVWLLDFQSLEDWKPGLPMNFARCNPHTMVVDHKLYVLGGFLPNHNQNQGDGWIEVFDPEEKKWESLPSPPDQIHSSIMISGFLKSKKEIIIAKQRWDRHPMLFYSYNIMTRCWNTLVPHESEASVHLPPNAGRAVTVGNTLYWISTEEYSHECTIRAYDLDRNMWFEDHLNTVTLFGRREYFTSIYSRGPGFLHLVDQKFCLLLQSSVKKKDPQPSIEYLYCVILDISPIYDYEHEDWGMFELTTLSVQKYSMDHYIHFLDCMLL